MKATVHNLKIISYETMDEEIDNSFYKPIIKARFTGNLEFPDGTTIPVQINLDEYNNYQGDASELISSMFNV